MCIYSYVNDFMPTVCGTKRLSTCGKKSVEKKHEKIAAANSKKIVTSCVGCMNILWYMHASPQELPLPHRFQDSELACKLRGYPHYSLTASL